MLTEQKRRCCWCLCFDLFLKNREAHIDRAKLFDRAESLRRREKQNQVSLVYFSTVNSPSWIKRESKLWSLIISFQKYARTQTVQKTWHSQDLTSTGPSLRPLRTSWKSNRSCLALPWIKIYTRRPGRNIAEFYNHGSYNFRQKKNQGLFKDFSRTSYNFQRLRFIK